MTGDKSKKEDDVARTEEDFVKKGKMLKFDKCPYCGDTRRIEQLIADDQVKQGAAREDLNAWLTQQNAIIADMSRPHLTVPVLHYRLGSCYACGAVYVIGAKVEQGMPQSKRLPTSLMNS